MTAYRIETRSFVCQVDTDDKGVIVAAAPLLRKFLGQSLSNLQNWCWKVDPRATIKKLHARTQ